MLADILIYALLLLLIFIFSAVIYKAFEKEIKLRRQWEQEDYEAERKDQFNRIMSQTDLKSGK